MPIEGTDRLGLGVDPSGNGARTPFRGTLRRNRLGSGESGNGPEAPLCRTITGSGARPVRWSAFSAAVSDLHARVRAAETKAAHLEFALVSNRRIGMAVGILMCRLQVTEDQAFAVLCKHSQDHNVKVRDLAEEVIYTGGI
jgi:hypothetical protein